MRPNRKIPVFLFWVLILVQFTVDIIRFDFWPLSPYPMYAHPRPIDAVYAFQIQAQLQSGVRRKISVPGGAATMYIYNQKIQDQDFSALENRMKKDVEAYLRQDPALNAREIKTLFLVRMGLAQDPVSQLISVTETNLHQFEF